MCVVAGAFFVVAVGFVTRPVVVFLVAGFAVRFLVAVTDGSVMTNWRGLLLPVVWRVTAIAEVLGGVVALRLWAEVSGKCVCAAMRSAVGIHMETRGHRELSESRRRQRTRTRQDLARGKASEVVVEEDNNATGRLERVMDGESARTTYLGAGFLQQEVVERVKAIEMQA